MSRLLRVYVTGHSTLLTHDGMVVIERLRHPSQMRRGSEQYENMKELVGASPDIEPSGEASLGPTNLHCVSFLFSHHCSQREGGRQTYSVEASAENVEEALEQDPVQTHALLQGFVPVGGGSVADRNHPGDTQTDEHRRAVHPPSRLSESVDPRHNAAAKAENEDLRGKWMARGLMILEVRRQKRERGGEGNKKTETTLTAYMYTVKRCGRQKRL